MIAIAAWRSGPGGGRGGIPVAWRSGPKPEKLCPISSSWIPSTSLQKTFARDTEEANAKLAGILVELRKGLPIPELAKRCTDTFAGTYLAAPVLWTESGAPVPPERYAGKG